jgi:DNA-binding protein H-NS
MSQPTPITLAAISGALPALTYKDLKTLAAGVDTAMADKRKEAEAELERQRAAMTAEFDLDIPLPRKGSRVRPRYRNPDDPGQTWSGRGKQPAWLTAKLDAGDALTEFEVSN